MLLCRQVELQSQVMQVNTHLESCWDTFQTDTLQLLLVELNTSSNTNRAGLIKVESCGEILDSCLTLALCYRIGLKL